MTQKENGSLTKYWLEVAEYDLAAALAIYKTEKYPYVLYLCHLSLEKILKALYVKKYKKHAPYNHNLVRLAELSIHVPEELMSFFAELTAFNIESRYPDAKMSLYKKANSKYTKKYLNKTIEVFECLKKELKS